MGFGTMARWAVWPFFEILLTLRETLFKSERFLFKINIPIFHHSIIPRVTQKVRPQETFIILISSKNSETFI